MMALLQTIAIVIIVSIAIVIITIVIIHHPSSAIRPHSRPSSLIMQHDKANLKTRSSAAVFESARSCLRRIASPPGMVGFILRNAHAPLCDMNVYRCDKRRNRLQKLPWLV
jgi:hypothetical protein